MMLARVYAILPCATADGVWHQRCSTFTTSLAEAIRLGQSVKVLERFEEPEIPPPLPPKAGTAGDDAPPKHRMMTRQNRRDDE